MTASTAERPAQNPAKISPSKIWLKALESAGRLTGDKSLALAGLLDAQALAFGAAPALIGETETLSYQALADRARRHTRWALDQGLRRGDVVALLAPNTPDYFAFWTGVGRTGATVSLLNTNLRGAALAHGINVARPGRLVVDASLAEAALEARPHFELQPSLWSLGSAAPTGGFSPLDPDSFSGAALDLTAFAPATQADAALHIFTSGTTGLPKADRKSVV